MILALCLGPVNEFFVCLVHFNIVEFLFEISSDLNCMRHQIYNSSFKFPNPYQK